MRACLVLLDGADDDAEMTRFAQAAFEAYWSRDEDISTDSVLIAVCRTAGVDADRVMSGINVQRFKDRLRHNTDELIERGGFGSPTMFVEGSDMYFGNDRLHFVREALLRVQGRD